MQQALSSTNIHSSHVSPLIGHLEDRSLSLIAIQLTQLVTESHLDVTVSFKNEREDVTINLYHVAVTLSCLHSSRWYSSEEQCSSREAAAIIQRSTGNRREAQHVLRQSDLIKRVFLLRSDAIDHDLLLITLFFFFAILFFCLRCVNSLDDTRFTERIEKTNQTVLHH